MDSQLEKYNLEQEIASLKEQRASVAKDLGKQHKLFDEAVKATERNKMMCAREVKSQNKIVDEAKDRVKAIKDAHLDAQRSFNIPLLEDKKRSVIKETKESISKLEYLNLRILNAEKSILELDSQVDTLNRDIEEKTAIKDTLELHSQEQTDHNNKLLAINKEISIQSKKLNAELIKKVDEAHQRMLEIEGKANQAETKFTSYNQLYTNQVKNLSIYTKRVKMMHDKATKKLNYANQTVRRHITTNK